MKEENMNNINFDEVEFPRYVKVKESIEDLMKIIDFDEVKKDGLDRVMSALSQLILENDDKTVEEKRAIIEDAIYNGNIFKHYFSEEKRAKALDVLSNTVLLNDDERLIYKVNFYMPNDINFIKVYNECNKDVEKIAEHYNLNNEDAYNLVYARATEISKFYDSYKAEKERQRISSKTLALAAVQEATEDPSKENIDKANNLLNDLNDDDLKNTLKEQLLNLQNNEIYIEPGIEELVLEDSLESIFSDEVEEPVNEGNETSETVEADDNFEAESEELNVAEPALLDDVLEETKEKTLTDEQDNSVGKDVMASLQSLVSTAKENARKVEQLSLELDSRDEQIAELHSTITANEEEINDKNKQLEEQGEKIIYLQQEVENKNSALDESNRLLALKEEQISSLTTSLNSYKASLNEIQMFLSNAGNVVQVEDNTRKLA